MCMQGDYLTFMKTKRSQCIDLGAGVDRSCATGSESPTCAFGEVRIAFAPDFRCDVLMPILSPFHHSLEKMLEIWEQDLTMCAVARRASLCSEVHDGGQ